MTRERGKEHFVGGDQFCRTKGGMSGVRSLELGVLEVKGEDVGTSSHLRLFRVVII